MTTHLNQLGGPHHPSDHPNVRGRERELRAMADAVRRLVAVTVTNDAGPAETATAAARLHELADDLERLVPAEAPPRYALAGRGADAHPHDYFQYDVMLGLYNPLALPIEMSWEPPRVVGRARFTVPYEGPPGCVHGAVIAGGFDQVFNVANLMGEVAGPTANLTIDYRRPTRLGVDLVFETWVDAVDGRKVTTRGHIRQAGEVTCTAAGLFIRGVPPETG